MYKLSEYLQINFPDIPLESPLFYNAPIGIRFELGVPYRGINTQGYFTNVILRSTMIFQEVFEEKDEMFVVVNSYKSVEPYKCFNQGEDVFSKYLRNKAIINNIESVETERYIEDNGDLAGIYYQNSLSCKRSDIDYVGIIKAKANQDFAINPYISDSVFFINIQKHIIFYMYDDRGMDLVSKDRESLIHLYEKYSDWILGYDRERIDKVFRK